MGVDQKYDWLGQCAGCIWEIVRLPKKYVACVEYINIYTFSVQSTLDFGLRQCYMAYDL